MTLLEHYIKNINAKSKKWMDENPWFMGWYGYGRC